MTHIGLTTCESLAGRFRERRRVQRRCVISGEVNHAERTRHVRAQREAADHVYTRLTAITDLLARLQSEVDALTANAELRAVLRQEQSWLERLQAAITDVRRFREQERLRFWPGVWRRWVLAVGFALAAAAAAGAGYAWARR